MKNTHITYAALCRACYAEKMRKQKRAENRGPYIGLALCGLSALIVLGAVAYFVF